MKIAITLWKDRVSPVFDAAKGVVLLNLEGDAGHGREAITFKGDDPFARVRSLQRHGVQVLICGAISQPVEMALISSGIRVIPFTCGHVDEVLKAFFNGKLNDKTFSMPGYDSRRIRRGDPGVEGRP
jgi:predicted Fe-Mo cluster-binding NifX family protein